MPRWLRTLTLGALASLVVGCQTYRPVTAPRSVGHDVWLRITFAAPRDVRLDHDGDTTSTLHGVWRLEGRVAAIVADTLRVDVGNAFDTSGTRFAATGRASVVPDAGTTIERREISTGMTLATGAGVVLVLSAVAVVLLIATIVRAAQ